MLTRLVNGEAVEMTEEEEAAMLSEWAALVPSAQDAIVAKIKALEEKVQEHLDAQARSMNFDNILSGISNASLSPGEYRQEDGAALLLWRARTWKKCAEVRDSFIAGQSPEPSWEDLRVYLPTYPIN